ncbi:MAG: 2-hydroxychromene-2-carboxylate isomerase [Myxococcota bacterium]
MSDRTLRFHFDYLSPYSYLAWQDIRPLCNRHALALEPAPTLLAALLNHHGHKGPGEIPPKRAYVYRDCLRRAAVMGVPFEAPHSHPFRPLLPLRVTGLDMPPDVREALISRLFAATWAHAEDVSDPSVVGAICEELGIVDAVARAAEPDIKARLKATTDDAIARGVFGVPTMIIGDALFWGADSFVHLERYLVGDDPLETADLSAWDALEPSATRRR